MANALRRPVFGIIAITVGLSATAAFAQNSRIDRLVAQMGVLSAGVQPGTVQEALIGVKEESYSGTGLNRVRVSRQNAEALSAFIDNSTVGCDMNSQALYVGNILQGRTLQSGQLSSYFGEDRNSHLRDRMVVSVSGLLTGAQSSSAKVERVTKAAVDDAVHRLVTTDVLEHQPVQLVVNTETSNSLSKSLLGVGINVSGAFGEVAAALRSSKSTSNSVSVVKVIQKYYTVSCNRPTYAARFFRGNPHRDLQRVWQLTNDPQNPNPPVYIQSVTYGRMLLMVVESDASESELDAAVKARAKGFGVSGSLAIDAKQMDVLKHSKFSLYAMGGDSAAVNAIVSSDDPMNGLAGYIMKGASYSVSSPGVPLSYTCRYLTPDNNVAIVQGAAKYEIATRVASPEAVPFALVGRLVTFKGDHSGVNDDDKDNGETVAMLLYRNGQPFAEVPLGGALFPEGSSVERSFLIDLGDPANQDAVFSLGAWKNGTDGWSFYTEIEVNGVIIRSVQASHLEDGDHLGMLDASYRTPKLAP